MRVLVFEPQDVVDEFRQRQDACTIEMLACTLQQQLQRGRSADSVQNTPELLNVGGNP